MKAAISSLMTPQEVAARIGCSERLLRKLARDHGLCRVFGQKMVFLQEDIDRLMEIAKPTPRTKDLSFLRNVVQGDISQPSTDPWLEELLRRETEEKCATRIKPKR